MKILLLDVYPDRPYRICKENNGAYGTANDYGDSLVARLLMRLVARAIDYPPLHAAYTLGQLAAAGHQVEYSREHPRGDYDLCIVPSSIVAHETELDAIKTITGRGIPVAVIGPFCNAMPAPYVEAEGIVVMGEPEMFFRGFSLPIDELKSLGPVISAADPVDLDELALPAWDVIFRSAPPKLRLLSGRGPMLPIIATRGCPYSCAHYCPYPAQQGRKLRSRSPEKVVAEMIHWKNVLGARNFLFRDPVFSTNRKFALSLCDAVIATGKKFRFAAEVHLKDLDEELIQRMRAAGLSLVYTGIESVTPQVLEDAHRMTIAVEEQTRTVRMLEKHGIRVKAMFMLGFPTDTLQTMEANLAYAKALCPAYAQFSVFTPYPGTPVFAEFRDKIRVPRFEDFTQWQLVFEHPNLQAADIRKFLGRAYHDYYTHLPWLMKTVKRRLFSAAR